jgi:hypothetical protein
MTHETIFNLVVVDDTSIGLYKVRCIALGMNTKPVASGPAWNANRTFPATSANRRHFPNHRAILWTRPQIHLANECYARLLHTAPETAHQLAEPRAQSHTVSYPNGKTNQCSPSEDVGRAAQC